jgi:hypothetical protein
MNTDKGQFGSMNVFRKGNPADTIELARRADVQNEARSEAKDDMTFDQMYAQSVKEGSVGARVVAKGTRTVAQAMRSAKDGNPLSVSGAELAKARAPKSTRGRSIN